MPGVEMKYLKMFYEKMDKYIKSKKLIIMGGACIDKQLPIISFLVKYNNEKYLHYFFDNPI